MLGKATTAVLLTGFASLIWDFPKVVVPFLGTIDVGFARLSLGGPRALGSYIVYVGVAMSLSAAVQYTFLARDAYREAVAKREAKTARPRG